MKELELILQTVAQLGAAGKEAFIWWLLADKLIPGLLLFTGFCIAVTLLFKTIRFTSLPERLRDAMGIGSPGYVTKGEIEAMFKWIDERKSR
jgi:hypothetical protein